MPNHIAKNASSSVVFAVATAPEKRILKSSAASLPGAIFLQTGVGPGPVRQMAGAIRAGKPAGLISIGTAGGLHSGLRPGHLLLPARVTTEHGEVFPVTPAWHARICDCLVDHVIETGTIVSVGRAVRNPRDKQQLAAQSGAVAVDMESAELARIAAQNTIPFLVMRTVADAHDQPLPQVAVAALSSSGDLRIAALLGRLLRRPGEIAALIRLQANFRTAGTMLAACCRAAGTQMCNPDA